MAETPIDIELYPEKALPQEKWPIKMSVKSVIDSDIENVLVARRVCGNEDELSYSMRNKRFLKQDALDSFVDEDLSMNLIGGGFLPEHCRFLPKNDVDVAWDGSYFLTKADLDGSIVEENEIGAFPATYYAYNLQDRRVPYYKKYNGVKEGLELIDIYSERLKDIIPEENKAKFIGVIALDHKPTLCNYWHVTLNYTDADGNLLKGTKGWWRKEFIHNTIKNYLEEIIPDADKYTSVFIDPTMHGRNLMDAKIYT